MTDSLRSTWEGIAVLSGAALLALLALLLTIRYRPSATDLDRRERTAQLFLIGLAAQCLHFTE